MTPEIQEMLRQMGKAAIRAFFAQARDVTAEHQHQRVGLAALREMIPAAEPGGWCSSLCPFKNHRHDDPECNLSLHGVESWGLTPGPDCPAAKAKEAGDGK